MDVTALVVRLEPLVGPGTFLLGVLLALAVRWRRSRRPARRLEARAARVLAVAGWPLAAGLFVLPLLAAWELQPTGAASATAALVGRIPHLDSHAHLEGAVRLLADGSFTDFNARRPLNACWLAVRLGLLGGSLPAALVVQALLLGLATAAAGRVAAARGGTGAALVFFGLVYGLMRDYAPTIATEPLGVTLALLGFALLLGRRDLPRFVLGLLLLDLALHARPGVQLLTPALGLWGLLVFRGRRLLVVVAVVAVMAGNGLLTSTLNARYGPPASSFFSYPAYTLYGLVTGSNYRQARLDHGPVLDAMPGEHERAQFLYRAARERFRARPLVLPATLLANAGEFLSKLVPNLGRIANPAMLLVGPREQVRLPDFVRATNVALGLPLLLAAAAAAAWRIRRRTIEERAFWGLTALAVITSAAVITGDAGFRGMAIAYPALATFLALGVASRRASLAPARGRGLESAAAAATAGLVLLALLGPAWLHGRWPRPDPALLAALVPGTDYVVRVDGATPRVVVWNAPPPELAPLAVSRKQFQNAIAVGEARHIEQLEQLRPPLVLMSVYDHVGRRLELLAGDPALAAQGGRFLHLNAVSKGDVLEVTSWRLLGTR